jgi:hypothetical protein
VNVCVVFVVVEKRCLFGDLTEYVDSPCQNEEVQSLRGILVCGKNGHEKKGKRDVERGGELPSLIHTTAPPKNRKDA